MTLDPAPAPTESSDAVLRPGDKVRVAFDFEGEAIQGENPAFNLSRGDRRSRALWVLRFGITAEWACTPRSLSYAGQRDSAGALAFRGRVLEALAMLSRWDRIDPTLMFSPACLNCGKRLTDPVSMARWIGPECAGTSAESIASAPRLAAVLGMTKPATTGEGDAR